MATSTNILDTTDFTISALRWIRDSTHQNMCAGYDDFCRHHVGKYFTLPEGSIRISCPDTITSHDRIWINLTQAGHFILLLADKLERKEIEDAKKKG